MIVEDYLVARYRVTESGCWQWTKGINEKGYGRARLGSVNRCAHLVAYEHWVGEVPKGLVLDHRCRNHGCINPSHLEPVTVGENNRRGVGFAGINSRKTSCNRGHKYTEENTLINKLGHRRCRVCRDEHNRKRYIK